jgi:hypothetical protein
MNAVEFCECLIAYFYSKIPFKKSYLLTCVPCSSFLWFPASIFNKVWRNPHLFGWKSRAWFTEELGPKRQYIRFPFMPNFHCRSFKNLLFFAFKTCCEILLCNSIAIIHYFWKTKVLNLKNFVSFWPIFLHDTPLKNSNFMLYFRICC